MFWGNWQPNKSQQQFRLSQVVLAIAVGYFALSCCSSPVEYNSTFGLNCSIKILFHFMPILTQSIGRTVIVNNKEYLLFSGYDYLGIQNNSSFKQLVKEGIDKYGWLFPSARVSNTPLQLYQTFETLLSSITNTAATVSFSSGFMAGTVAANLFHQHPQFVYSLAHPAINKNKIEEQDFDSWLQTTITTINENQFAETPVIIADSVNPLKAAIYNFSALHQLNKKVIVIIDDSHGIGIIGQNGKGISSYLPQQENIEYLLVYSLSKAFSINAGAISCSNETTAQKIRKTPEFTASTSVSPALIHAFIEGQKIYAEAFNHLKENIAFIAEKLQQNEQAITNTQLPIILLNENINEAYFEAKNIIISSFNYATSNGKKINRAVISALHTKDDLQQLITALS